jgi:hypothetical protein
MNSFNELNGIPATGNAYLQSIDWNFWWFCSLWLEVLEMMARCVCLKCDSDRIWIGWWDTFGRKYSESEIWTQLAWWSIQILWWKSRTTVGKEFQEVVLDMAKKSIVLLKTTGFAST